MEKTTRISVPFEWCHYCKAFEAETDKVYSDAMIYMVVTHCKNSDICDVSNAARRWLEVNRKEQE